MNASPTPAFLHEPEVKQLLNIAAENNIELRFVGGCVRDYLMQKEVYDLDLATPSLPQQIIDIYEKYQIKTIPTGIKHGTVTVVINKRHFEITTLRKDVECDGRHAITEPTTNWTEDASRRDFTMNGLYMCADGEIIDLVDGMQDAKLGRLRFIGDANTRIKEDYLRILRYFRFFATHAKQPPLPHEIAACAAAATNLNQISPERICTEMQKLLCAENPIPSLKLMINNQIWEVISDNAEYNLESLSNLINREKNYNVPPNPWRRLVALTDFQAEKIATKWRTSKAIKQYLHNITSAKKINNFSELRLLHNNLKENTLDALLIHANEDNIKDLVKYLENYQPKPLPITAHELIQNGFQGKEISAALQICNEIWLESDFSSSTDEMLKFATNTISNQQNLPKISQLLQNLSINWL
jgi:poly(A) polymerase